MVWRCERAKSVGSWSRSRTGLTRYVFASSKCDSVGTSTSYPSHAPCHTQMKRQDPLETVKALVGKCVVKNERCYGGSGALGVTLRTSRRRSASARKMSCEEEDEPARQRQGGSSRETEDPDQLPQLSARPEPLRQRPAEGFARSRLHRRRESPADPRRDLDARVRG